MRSVVAVARRRRTLSHQCALPGLRQQDTLRSALKQDGDATMAASFGHSGSNGSLTGASADRLACLLRHWTWADEARARFEQELAEGWDYNEEPVADHPFGVYYHWCALLCGLSEAALEHGLLSPWQLEAIRGDLVGRLLLLRE